MSKYYYRKSEYAPRHRATCDYDTGFSIQQEIADLQEQLRYATGKLRARIEEEIDSLSESLVDDRWGRY
jgi:hypothetical protein